MPGPQNQSRVAAWLLILLLGFCALLGRGIYAVRPFDSDSSMFIYMGRLISEGGRFGHEIVDNKFPTVGLLMSAPWRWLGTNWPAWVGLGMGLSVLGSLSLARSAGRTFGSQAWRPTLLASLVFLNFNFAVFGGFQLETLHAFFATLAAGAALEALRKDDLRDSFVVGLAVGIAAYAKPTALSVAGAFGLAMLVCLRRQPGRLAFHGIAALCGMLVPTLAFFIYLNATGTVSDLGPLSEQISRYAKNSAWDWLDLNKPITVMVLGGFPLLVRYWIFRRPEHRLERESNRDAAIFVVAWLTLELIGVVMQRRMYAYHFLPLAPPLALLFGLLPRRDDIKPLAAALVPLALFSMLGTANVIRYEYCPGRPLEASTYLRQHALLGDRIWQDDSARLLLETGLRPGSRHPLTFLFANWDTAPLEYARNMLEDFRTLKPQFIVLDRDLDRYVAHQRRYILELERFPKRGENYTAAWKQIEQFVQSEYRPVARVDRQVIWQRMESSDTASAMDATSP